MLLHPNQPLFQAPLGLRSPRRDAATRCPAADTSAHPFLKAHHGMIPRGPILFLGGGGSQDAVLMAGQGRSVTIFDDDAARLAAIGKAASAADVRLELRHHPVDAWRLGYQHWAGIVVLSCTWPTPQRRRLFGRIPNALMPGGVFLMEAESVGPMEVRTLDDCRLDPGDTRPELEILFLPRFVTLSRPCAADSRNREATFLQVVGVHLESDGLDDLL